MTWLGLVCLNLWLETCNWLSCCLVLGSDSASLFSCVVSQLMAKESMVRLGFGDLKDSSPSQAEKDSKPWAAAADSVTLGTPSVWAENINNVTARRSHDGKSRSEWEPEETLVIILKWLPARFWSENIYFQTLKWFNLTNSAWPYSPTCDLMWVNFVYKRTYWLIYGNAGKLCQ